ncbi:MAG: phosphoribosylformylglycinamidine cyclo-ligase [Defluviitaleaceae bacterium]|nr:phosphoribosylformylglycinamidine cyclo-ligase [Defluviitaleaceae bacterium]MCL2261817.1 phosphoribosylformylglycinamidine cyclo-ligase [Defluviitaleaceae bacterium]
MSESYKKAGVDIHAGYDAVQRIKKHVERTKTAGVVGGLGGFGGLFDLSAVGKYEEPVLVSGTDGVGTKLMLAFKLGKHDTIGVDAVAMCVNDIITVGAKPLFFLDYIACGKVLPDVMEDIVKGIAEGCVQSGCALIGGEMAEHPDMMPQNEYDIAGFCVGIAEKSKMITGDGIKEGDALVGIASSGVHSNGFSLIRKIVADNNLDLGEVYFDDKPLGEILLTPTRIYAKSVGLLCEKFELKGMAHITGGGFIENIPRILPQGLGAEILADSWVRPPVFAFLQKYSHICEEEMFNLYNMGIGMVVAVDAAEAENAADFLRANGEKAYVIGSVISGEGVVFK